MSSKAIGMTISCAVGVIVLTIVYIVLLSPSHNKVQAITAKATVVQEQGQTAAAQDAGKVITNNAVKSKTTDTTTQGNYRAITKAPGAAQPTNAAVDLAGRRAICLRQSARDLPECQRLRITNP